jgi:hypothetical protein
MQTRRLILLTFLVFLLVPLPLSSQDAHHGVKRVAEIICCGYGLAHTGFPFKYMEEFRRYEREARENERGLLGK